VRVLAILAAPLLLALALFGWRPSAGRGGADHVLNGVIRREPAVALVRRALAASPDVVLLGNSNANTDIDVEVLSDGLATDRVARLTIPNSSAAHWTAILRRARDVGASPRTVLVVSRLQLVIVGRPISEGARASFAGLLGPGDEDLRRAAGLGSAWVARARERREGLRDRASRALRAALPWAVAGVESPEPALRRALSDARIDPSRLRRPPPLPLPDPEEGLLPALLAEAQALGARLVFVRPPQSLLLTNDEGDNVPPDALAATRALIEAGGAELIDFSSLEMPLTQYGDPSHLDAEGARRFTGAMVAALSPPRGDRVGALGELRVEGGVARRDFGTARYATDPPPIAVTPVPGGARVDPRWPDDGWTASATKLRVACSPVRVAVDGVPVRAGLDCEDVQRRPGTSCHTGEVVAVHAPAGEITAWLDPERSCDGARWLYPGDRVEIRWPPVGEGPLDRLEVEVASPAPAAVGAELRIGGRTVAAGEVRPAHASVFPLGGAVGEPVLVLTNGGDGPVLATRAELIR
jgi:hypothetical protein